MTCRVENRYVAVTEVGGIQYNRWNKKLGMYYIVGPGEEMEWWKWTE